MAVELPVDSHASKAITDECYSNWETGGRVKLWVQKGERVESTERQSRQAGSFIQYPVWGEGE